MSDVDALATIISFLPGGLLMTLFSVITNDHCLALHSFPLWQTEKQAGLHPTHHSGPQGCLNLESHPRVTTICHYVQTCPRRLSS